MPPTQDELIDLGRRGMRRFDAIDHAVDHLAAMAMLRLGISLPERFAACGQGGLEGGRRGRLHEQQQGGEKEQSMAEQSHREALRSSGSDHRSADRPGNPSIAAFPEY